MTLAEEMALYESARRVRRELIASAHAASPAIIVVGYGRETLLIVTPEIGHDGVRATQLDHDGPTGHISASDVAKLLIRIDEEYRPTAARPATEDEVIAWTSTPEFQRGAEHVALVQRENAGRVRSSEAFDHSMSVNKGRG